MVFLLGCMLAVGAGEAWAATAWTVNSNADTNTGSGNAGTLRWVIGQAASGDAISFDSSVSAISTSGIDYSDKTLSFASDHAVTISYSGADRNILDIGFTGSPPANVTIGPNITFSDGSIVWDYDHGDTDTYAAGGGAISSYGRLGRIDADFAGNSVTTTGAANSGGLGARGGALQTYESIDGVSGTYTGNSAFTGVDGTSGNAWTYGGAVSAEGSIGTVAGVYLNNTATARSDSPGTAGGLYARGGAVHAQGTGAPAAVAAVDARFTGNRAEAIGWRAGVIENDQRSAEARGGGLTSWTGVGSISANSLFHQNTAQATAGKSSATAAGGGANIDSITSLAGIFSENQALAAVKVLDVGNAEAYGGGLSIDTGNSMGTSSADFTQNLAKAESPRSADAYGGGMYGQIRSGMGNFTDNTAEASGTSLGAKAQGGGWSTGGGIGGEVGGIYSGNTASASSVSGDSNAGGGGLYVGRHGLGNVVGPLSATFTGNKALAVTSGGSQAAAASGGAVVANDISAVSGNYSANKAEANSFGGMADAHGGGIDADGGNIGEIGAGVTFNGNEALAVSTTGQARAKGGAILASVIGNIDGAGQASGIGLGATFTNNKAESTVTDAAAQPMAIVEGGAVSAVTIAGNLAGTFGGNSGKAENSGRAAMVHGGALYLSGSVEGDLSASFNNNRGEAKALNSGGAYSAWAYGGGAVIGSIEGVLAGTFSGNSVVADSVGGGKAQALGGGLFLYNPRGLVVKNASFRDNSAIAAGAGAGTQALGGAVFFNTSESTGPINVSFTADSGQTLLFSGNKVTKNGAVTANAAHFGSYDASSPNTTGAVELTVSGAGTVDLQDPLSVALSHDTAGVNPGFTLNKTGAGTFKWGGANVFDSKGGGAVNLRAGLTSLYDGFSLDIGGVNSAAPVAFAVAGGHLKSEGAAAGLNRTALRVASSGKLTVDLGSTLTLDAASTFALNGGTLSFGVGAGDASGKIVSLNTTKAPTFAGSNTLDISRWQQGAYTVLQAGAAMSADAPGTFSSITVGGNAVDPAVMNISAALVNSGKDLQITAATARYNKEAAWGGTSGTWNYTNKNWLDGATASTFLPGDAALFNNSGADSRAITVGGNAVSLSGMKVTGGASYDFTGGALHIDSSTAQRLTDPGYADNLVMAGSGTLFLNNGGAANPNRITGNVSVTGGTLALGDGFALTNTGAGGVMNIDMQGSAAPALDLRGAAALNNMNLQLINGASELRFTAPGSALSINSGNTSYLGAGVMDVDLNRSKTLAALTLAAGSSLDLEQSSLRLRHTGLGNDSGSWLLVNGNYSGEFSAVDIATATLTGKVNYDAGNSRILFDGVYTPLAPGGLTGLERLSPNARSAAAGLLERVENGSGPAYNYLYGLSGDAFNNAALGILPYASAEGAVTQSIQSLSAHNAAAMAAFGYAFGSDAPASTQSFAPLAFQAPNTLGWNIGSQNRREQARATGRYADRMAALDGEVGYGHSGYSVLGDWHPATDTTRGLVASASPEYTLNAAGPNTSFGARIWGGYLGNFAHQDSKGGYAGYDADQNGFLLGGSFDITPNWTAGAYVGWTTGDTRYSGIRTRIDTDATHVGAFARYKKQLGSGTAKVTGDILYSYTDNDSRRTVPAAPGNQHMKGGFDQNIIGGGLEAAYDWRPSFDPALVLTPYAAGRYARLEQDGFTESGNLGLKVGKTDADSFVTTVGLKAARDFNASGKVILTPKVTAGWLHQWADRDIAANSSFVGSPVTFMTRSVKQDADAALLGAGLDVLVKTGRTWNLGLKLGYGADIRRNSNDQTVFAGLEVKF